MKRRTFSAAGLATLVWSGRGRAQSDYPSRVLRLVVPFAPGGATAVTARLVAQRLSDGLKQQVLVENRPGGGSIVGTDFVAKAAPDGYTLAMVANSGIAPGPLMRASMPYDALADFTHLVLVGSFPNGLVVRADHPARSMAELVALARARPGVLNYSSAGVGSSGFLSGELLKQKAGVDIVHIPYKGSGPATADLLGGQLDAMFDGLVTATSHVRSGRMRLLAVTSAERARTCPEVPSTNEVVPGVVGAAWFGVSAPARLPQAIAERLSGEILKVLALPEVKTRLGDIGMTVRAGGPREYLAHIAAENNLYGPLIRAAGIRID